MRKLTEADHANLSLLEASAPLRRILETADVVASDAMPPEVVTMNTQVVVQDETSGERRALRVVFPSDADPSAGLISVREPLGVQLLGASAGQVVECALGDGSHSPLISCGGRTPRRRRLRMRYGENARAVRN